MTANEKNKLTEILDGTPPHDADAEQGLIGSIFMRPDCLDDVGGLVAAVDFHDDRHRALYSRLLAMHEAGKRIDTVLFASAAKKGGTLERCGGVSYLSEIMQATYTAAHAAHYAKIVREHALQRALRDAGLEILRVAAEDQSQAGDAIDAAERMVFDIRERHAVTASRSASIAEVLGDVMAEIEKRSLGEMRAGLPTGFPDLDRLIGCRPGELLILAARPGIGKTSLAICIAANVAVERAEPVLFFSMEMSSAQLANRLLSSWSGVNSHSMAEGTLIKSEREKIIEATAVLSQTPFFIDDSPHLTVQAIGAIARRQKRKAGLSLLVVDYLQLIQADNSREPREQQVAAISRRLKGLARELDVPLLCLAQLNRGVESAKDNKPRLSHLRESGSIEQDADVVVFIHRPEVFLDDPTLKAEAKGKAEILVEKNRNGPTGITNLCWLAEITAFRNLSPRDQLDF